MYALDMGQRAGGREESELKLESTTGYLSGDIGHFKLTLGFCCTNPATHARPFVGASHGRSWNH